MKERGGADILFAGCSFQMGDPRVWDHADPVVLPLSIITWEKSAFSKDWVLPKGFPRGGIVPLQSPTQLSTDGYAEVVHTEHCKV